MARRTDEDLAEFLIALDKAAATVECSDWEASFVESNMTRDRFSPKQREIIEQMIERYGDKVKW